MQVEWDSHEFTAGIVHKPASTELNSVGAIGLFRDCKTPATVPPNAPTRVTIFVAEIVSFEVVV